jgi:hypothetical protein
VDCAYLAEPVFSVVVRGASFEYALAQLSPSTRSSVNAMDAYADIGFRCARTP